MAVRSCYKCFTVSLVPVAAFTLAVVFASGIIILPVVYEEMASRINYGAVIDAGSSHTVMYLYKWNIPKSNKGSTIEDLHQIFCVSLNKSLNSFKLDPESAGKEVIQPLLNVSRQQNILKEEEMESTYIFLGATAGMRLVHWEYPSASDAIMQSVRHTLANSSYRFERQHATIISGKVEAASGWVTVNYAAGNFETSSQSTYGSLDMGGASSEIAFKPPSGVVTPAEYSSREKVFNSTYDIYARSYLCYGLNEARWRFLAHLIDEQGGNVTNVTDPCLFKGTNITYLRDQIYSICVNESKGQEVFGHRLSPHPSLSADHAFTFVGTNDTEQCKGEIAQVFNFTACPVNGTCIGGDYSVPPASGTFKAFSGFYIVADFFNITGPSNNPIARNGSYLSTTFQSLVKQYCQLNFTRANHSHPSVKPSNLDRFCFDGFFMLHLLTKGFGFNGTSSANISFVDEINSISPGWAMGYLANMTQVLTTDTIVEHPYSAVDLVIGIIVLSILTIVFVLFFLLTFQACQRVLTTRSGYTDIA